MVESVVVDFVCPFEVHVDSGGGYLTQHLRSKTPMSTLSFVFVCEN